MNDTLQSRIASSPKLPGCYIFRDKKNAVIYAGKAKVLSSRVRSYFHKKSPDDIKIIELVKQIADVEYIIASSETEALLQEYRLIKEYKPWFNSQLIREPMPALIRIDLSAKYPGISIVDAGERACEDEFARADANASVRTEYIGSFTNRDLAREAVDILNLGFRTPVCLKAPLPSKPCLYLSINQCSGPCTANITPDAYRRDILGAIALLKGEKVPILDQLEKDIVMYSDRFEYEKAASAKKKLLALEKLRLKSHKLFQLSHNIDAVLLLRAYHAAECTVFFIQEERVVNHTHINTTMDSDEMSSRVGQCLRAEPSILKEAWLTSCVKEVYADKKYFPFMQETSPEQNIRNVLTCVIEFMSAG